MGKSVVLSRSAYEWLLRHRFMSEEVIIGVVKSFPLRNYLNDEYFDITFRRKKNHGLVSITIFMHETSERLLVYKVHSQRL